MRYRPTTWGADRPHEENDVTDTNKTAAATGTTAAAAAAPAAEKAKTVGGFAMTAKITFGKKEDGKTSYDGAENNPKRKGSKSFDKFAKYKDGMTVEDAVKAGITGADLSWDSRHGFIKVA